MKVNRDRPRTPRCHRLAVVGVILTLVMWAATTRGEGPPDPDPTRFSARVADLTAAASISIATPLTLFVGSSSIRYWSLDARFPELTTRNHGLPGAHLSDLLYYVEPLVLRHAPARVVVYAGDNDIADGKSEMRVADDYRRLARRILDVLPRSQLIFLSIKASPARWRYWPRMRAANERILAHSAATPRLHYLDVSAPMLDAGKRPRQALFATDGLHLSTAGYDVWTRDLRRLLETLPPP